MLHLAIDSSFFSCDITVSLMTLGIIAAAVWLAASVLGMICATWEADLRTKQRHHIQQK